jgi:hypothetical protein
MNTRRSGSPVISWENASSSTYHGVPGFRGLGVPYPLPRLYLFGLGRPYRPETNANETFAAVDITVG